MTTLKSVVAFFIEKQRKEKKRNGKDKTAIER